MKGVSTRMTLEDSETWVADGRVVKVEDHTQVKVRVPQVNAAVARAGDKAVGAGVDAKDGAGVGASNGALQVVLAPHVDVAGQRARVRQPCGGEGKAQLRLDLAALAKHALLARHGVARQPPELDVLHAAGRQRRRLVRIELHVVHLSAKKKKKKKERANEHAEENRGEGGCNKKHKTNRQRQTGRQAERSRERATPKIALPLAKPGPSGRGRWQSLCPSSSPTQQCCACPPGPRWQASAAAPMCAMDRGRNKDRMSQQHKRKGKHMEAASYAVVGPAKAEPGNASLVLVLEDRLDLQRSRVPDVNDRVLADLARGHQLAVGMHRHADNVVVMGHEEALLRGSSLLDDADTGHKIHNLLAAAQVVQVAAHLMASVAIHPVQAQLRLGRSHGRQRSRRLFSVHPSVFFPLFVQAPSVFLALFLFSFFFLRISVGWEPIARSELLRAAHCAAGCTGGVLRRCRPSFPSPEVCLCWTHLGVGAD